MNSPEITEKWTARTLTHRDILAYLMKNVFPMHEDSPPQQLQAVTITNNCFSLYQWSIGEGMLGHFLTAVKDNNWAGICDHADGVNTRFHWVYRVFLYNCAPGNWRKRDEEDEDADE